MTSSGMFNYMDIEEHKETCQIKDCELCTDDDEKIRVSVNPRRFTLPRTSDKKTKMEIKNQNPYPIYFRADTSNMDAFRTLPNTGRIPPNSKVCVVVQFFDSVTPIRMHEEVIVLTSVKPFDEYTKSSICPYCYQDVYLSKGHHSNSSEFSEGSEERYFFNGGKQLPYTIVSSKEDQNGSEQIVIKKYSPANEKERKAAETYLQSNVDPSEMVAKRSGERNEKENSDHRFRKRTELPEMVAKHSGERHGKENSDHRFRKRTELPEMVTKYSGERREKENGNHHIRKSADSYEMVAKHSVERSEKENCDPHFRKLGQTKCKLELEEICLHAFIHRPTNGSCGCNNCAELSVSPEGGLRIQEIQHGKFGKVRRLSDPEVSSAVKSTGSGGLYTIKEDEELKTKTGARSKKEDRKSKENGREAHILARIKKAADTKETSDSSGTSSSSETSSKDMHLKRKIISEEEFKKKVEKAKKRKYQKQLEEESKSTTTTEGITAKDEEHFQKKVEDKTAPTKKERKGILKSIDEKCSRILTMNWTIFFFLIILLILMVSYITYFNFVCTPDMRAGKPYYVSHCFFHFFK